MLQIIKEITVDVTKPNVFQAIVAKQYDMNTRFLKVTFADCGNKIDIPFTATSMVVINAERKDGQSKGFDGVINDDGTVTVPLHSWMLELDGSVICDISVIDTAAESNKKLTTTSFTLLVEKAAYGGDDITSDPQYDVLVQLIEEVNKNAVTQEELGYMQDSLSRHEAAIENLQSEHDEILYDDICMPTNDTLIIDLGKEVSHLKIFASIPISGEGTTGGKEFYCQGICKDGVEHIIAYRSSVPGTATDNLIKKLTFSGEWQVYAISGISDDIGMAHFCDFFVFAGNAANNNNHWVAATAKDVKCSKPSKIKFRVPNVALSKSYILIKGY